MWFLLLIIPPILLYFFRKKPANRKHEIVVHQPDLSSLGIMLTVMCALVMTIFTITDSPLFVFYITFFSGYFLGIYFLWIAGYWELIIRQEYSITLSRLCFPTVQFTLDDVISVKLEKRNNYYGSSEQVVIRTSSKKIVVDKKCSNYKRLLELLSRHFGEI